MAGELILVVEDNDRNRKLVRDVLHFAGYRTLCAESGEEGLALAREHRPDLVLMDVQLPGMDGVETLQSLRTGSDTARIRCVALTAFAMKTDRERFLRAGFDAYLEKPIDVGQFPGQVRAFLAAGGAEAPS